MVFIYGLLDAHINDFHILVPQEIPSGLNCVWCSIISGQCKDVLEGSSWLGLDTWLQHVSVHLLVHGAMQHNQFTFVTIMKSSPYNDKGTDITISSLHTGINVSLTLPAMHPSSSICVMQLES